MLIEVAMTEIKASVSQRVDTLRSVLRQELGEWGRLIRVCISIKLPSYGEDRIPGSTATKSLERGDAEGASQIRNQSVTA